jgi:hypothetical protein
VAAAARLVELSGADALDGEESGRLLRAVAAHASAEVHARIAERAWATLEGAAHHRPRELAGETLSILRRRDPTLPLDRLSGLPQGVRVSVLRYLVEAEDAPLSLRRECVTGRLRVHRGLWSTELLIALRHIVTASLSAAFQVPAPHVEAATAAWRAHVQLPVTPPASDHLTSLVRAGVTLHGRGFVEQMISDAVALLEARAD